MSRARERLRALRRHAAPGPSPCAAARPAADPSGGRPEPRLPRCSDSRDLTASAHLKTLEPDDIEFFKEHG